MGWFCRLPSSSTLVGVVAIVVVVVVVVAVTVTVVAVTVGVPVDGPFSWVAGNGVPTSHHVG